MASPPRPVAPLRVLLVDDHRVFTDLFALALDTADDLHCAATAATLDEARRKLEAYDVDVVVIDVHLGDDDGLAALPALGSLRPRARFVVLTGHPTAAGAARARAAGASAYLAKDTRLDALTAAIRSATPQRPVVADGLPLSVFDALSPRERDVLALLCAGLRPTAIAAELGLSTHTARDHLKALRLALGARSQVEVVSSALAQGLVSAGRP